MDHNERALAVRYSPVAGRAGLAALLALDDRLATILRSTTQPIVGQMRLAWWREALVALDTAPSPAEPVLQALAAGVTRHVPGATLAAMVDGWEALLDAPLTAASIDAHAERRGAALFAAAAAVLGLADPRVAAAGRGWALADLSRHLSDRALADCVRADAAAALAEGLARRWPARGRALGAMAHLARLDLAGRPEGHPARASRLLWHRATGR